jgi:hypothetical protein
VKRLIYLSVAEAELAEAADYYESRQQGLAHEFLDAARECESLIRSAPELCGYYDRPFRSARLKRFPYRLIFREEEDRLVVVCVMHLSRRPGYWKDRIH